MIIDYLALFANMTPRNPLQMMPKGSQIDEMSMSNDIVFAWLPNRCLLILKANIVSKPLQDGVASYPRQVFCS